MLRSLIKIRAPCCASCARLALHSCAQPPREIRRRDAASEMEAAPLQKKQIAVLRVLRRAKRRAACPEVGQAVAALHILHAQLELAESLVLVLSRQIRSVRIVSAVTLLATKYIGRCSYAEHPIGGRGRRAHRVKVGQRSLNDAALETLGRNLRAAATVRRHRRRGGGMRERSSLCAKRALALIPCVRVTSVLPTLRWENMDGALISYQSFFAKGSALREAEPRVRVASDRLVSLSARRGDGERATAGT